MSSVNEIDSSMPPQASPRCPKCHVPMTLTDVTLGPMDRYTRTFECSICNGMVTIRAPDVTEIEAELGEARARVAELEAELPEELKDVATNEVLPR
jgi:transcription initiation factor IIE alpha subunit